MANRKATKSAKPAPKARSAKAPAHKGPELIASAVQAKTGNGLVVTTTLNRSVVVTRVDRKVNQLAKIGEPVAALEGYLSEQPKPEARLAKGVDSHNSPQSAKAIADQKAALSAKGKPAKEAKPAAPKAAKNKAPARGAERDYKAGKTAIAAKPDTWRHHMLTTIVKHTNTAKAKAAHDKSGKFSSNKLDFNWAAAQGYIVWAK